MSDAPGPSGLGRPHSSKKLPSFGFGIIGLKRFPELIPIVGVVSCAVIGGLFFMAYNLARKPDVKILRGNGCIKTEWEDVKPSEKRKLIVVNPELYKPIQEVESIKREIGSFKR